jgi:septum formation protein
MSQQSHKRNLILASSSPYRKSLLERLGIPFQVCLPDVDETPQDAESATRLVSRLAKSKAASLAAQFPHAVIIGSDQVAVCGDEIVGKPHNVTGAIGQLQRFSGQTVRFLTAVCVICESTAFEYLRTVITDACFRNLSDDEIERYVALDQPLDCAGSFKSEAAGIGLLSAMKSDDPTAIVGLPLIALSDALRSAGFKVP